MAEGVLETTEYEIDNLVLISATGLSIDIKFLAMDLNIYEDIFSSVISGDILINDTQNLPAMFNLHGNEYLYIKITTPTLNSFERYFRIYKISNLNLKNLNSFTYTIHFCSEEFIINQQKRISKSYKNVKNSDIVKDILINQLRVSPDRMKTSVIEETQSVQNLIVPNMKPLEAINWVGSFSIDDKLSSAYIFYENQDGFNFRSLSSIYNDVPYKKIVINPKNILTDSDQRAMNSFVPDRFEIKQAFDILETESSGGFSSSMIKLDITSQQHIKTSFNPIKNKFKNLNEFISFNDSRNRFDETLIESSAYVRYFPAFQGNLVDKWLLQRAAQLSLLNSNRMNIQFSGDSQMKVGLILDLDFPLIQPIGSSIEADQDMMKSGLYLVTAVRHRIVENKYYMYLEICKDSNKGAIPPAPDIQVLYDVAKKS